MTHDTTRVRRRRCGVVDPRRARKLHAREPRDPVAIRSQKGAERWEKAMSYKTHAHGKGESHSGIVLTERSNEGRAKGWDNNKGRHSTGNPPRVLPVNPPPIWEVHRISSAAYRRPGPGPPLTRERKPPASSGGFHCSALVQFMQEQSPARKLPQSVDWNSNLSPIRVRALTLELEVVVLSSPVLLLSLVENAWNLRYAPVST